MGIRYAPCAMRFALFRRGLTLRLRLRSVLGDCAGDALWVNPEQVEGLTSPYQFNTLLVVFSTIQRASGCLHYVIGPKTFHLEPMTFDLEPKTYNLRPITSNL